MQNLLRLPPASLIFALVCFSTALETHAAIPALVGGPVAPKIVLADVLSLASLAEQRAALQKEIATSREELAKLADGMSEDSARWLTQETALLERIDAVYADQMRTVQHATDLANEAALIDDRTQNRRPPEAMLKPPYSLELLDAAYAERDYLDQAGEVLTNDISSAEASLQEARDTLTTKDRQRRAVRGSSLSQGHPGDGNLRMAALESRLAAETLVLREHALRTLRLQASLIKPKQQLARPQLDWIRAHFQAGPDVRPEPTEQQLKLIASLDDAIAVALKDADVVTARVIALERRKGDKAAEEVEARRADRQTANLTLSVLTAQRERLGNRSAVMVTRRQVLSSALPKARLKEVARANDEELTRLSVDRDAQVRELNKSRSELQDWQRRMSRAAAADEARTPWSVDRVKRLSGWINLSEVELAQIDERRTERARLKEELGEVVTVFSLRESSGKLRNRIGGAWDYEVFSVKDEPVRVKTIVYVFLLLVLGYHAADRISRVFSQRVLKRLGMNTGRRAAAQALWFYVLFAGVLFAALNLFHLSLTQFSVVSGALAVGIGFGSQTLIGNFISGIILLIERPVSQGDVIEIDGRQVTVEKLGPRSTIVRSADNTHVIVPNSRLLERPVTNWTMSDDVVRKRVRVGVAYGSPARKVAELLKGVLAGAESVRKEPAPIVKFSDFGEHALIFELYFWAAISDPLDAESEIRHRIAEVLEAERVIATPTRGLPFAVAGGERQAGGTDRVAPATHD